VVEAKAANDEGEGRERGRRDGTVIERDALLLEIAVVGERETLQVRKHGDEIADEASGAAAD
jgi:hypothetical protein